MNKLIYTYLRTAFVAFVTVALPLLSGVGQGSWSSSKDVALAALFAGLAAAGHAVLNAFTKGALPFQNKGVLPPTH
jgi:hypothetical protein